MNDIAVYYRKQFKKLAKGISWLSLAACATAAVIALAIAIAAWHQSFRHLDVPLQLQGDAISVQHVVKTVIDHGRISVNPDLGAPFAEKMYDFPRPNPTLFGSIWVLGLFSKNPFVVFNLFYLLGFVCVAWSSCWAFMRCGIPRMLALAGAIAYAILPFHFFRLPHTYLAFYFAVPVFCTYALLLAADSESSGTAPARLTLGTLLLIAIAAGGGVYYAFFGCIFIAAGAVYGAVQDGNMTKLRTGTIYVSVIAFVIGINLIPSFLYHMTHGANYLVANRNPADAETYALRITQLLLPTPGHRFAWARTLIDRYNSHAPMVNENATATLGVLGSAGFLISLAAFLFGRRREFETLSPPGLLNVTGVLYATIGGFGALAAFLIIPEIRGLNRISVFIAFFSLFALLTVLSTLARRIRRRNLVGVLAIAMVVVAWADQVPVHALPGARQAHQRDAASSIRREAYARLQAAVPRGTAIYQLPYVYFPESPNMDEGPYTLFIPYLYTHDLRWSFGGVRGRTSDIWNKRVSRLTGHSFANALASAGFGAVYVDGKGFKDHGVEINKRMSALFGLPVWRFDDETLYHVPAQPQAKPYVVIGYGQGWYYPESSGSGPDRSTWEWSRGNATLNIGNPGNTRELMSVHFILEAITRRTVNISYGHQDLGTITLRPGRTAFVHFDISTKPGPSQIWLTTNRPAKSPGTTDTRKLAFQLINLVAKSHHTPEGTHLD